MVSTTRHAIMMGAANQSIPSGVPTPLRFPGAAEGGFAYSISAPVSSGIGEIGVYFVQGRFGALFYPQRSDDAIIYRNLTQVEFEARVKAEFGFEIRGAQIS